MRVGYSCQLVSSRPFGVSNCILELARALASEADGDALTLYVKAPLSGFEGGVGGSLEQRRSPAATDSASDSMSPGPDSVMAGDKR